MPIRNGKFVTWEHYITEIQHMLHVEANDKEAEKIAKKIHTLLNTTKYKHLFKNFEKLNDLNYIDNVEEFNDWLDSFYDYCDYKLIWVE